MHQIHEDDIKLTLNFVPLFLFYQKKHVCALNFGFLYYLLATLYSKVSFRMSDIDIVDFKKDVHLNESTRIKRELISFGNRDEVERIGENIVGYSIFDSDEIDEIEQSFDQMTERAAKVSDGVKKWK